MGYTSISSPHNAVCDSKPVQRGYGKCSVLHNCYIRSNFWSQYKIVVAIQAVVTQIIFDHALRIRLNSASQKESDSIEEGTLNSRSIEEGSETTVVAEETASGHGEGVSESSDSRGTGGTETPRSTGASSDNVKKEDAEQKTGEDKDKDQDPNMVGRINNLITTDVSDLESGQTLFMCSQFVLL